MTKQRSKEARKAAGEARGGAVDDLVQQFRKSKKQRALERFQRRKERDDRGRVALARLAGQKEVADKLRDLGRQQKSAEHGERVARKEKVASERAEVRRRRRAVEQEKSRALTEFQSHLQDKHAEQEQAKIDKRLQKSKAAQAKMRAEDEEWQRKKDRGEETLVCRTTYVEVNRPPEAESARRQLPMLNVEQEVMEAITALTTNALVLCGETGSGKTTQLPQFLWEAGYAGPRPHFGGAIAVTQPRRVAARAMAERVAGELCVEFGEEVSYQVRYDHNLSPKTKIKFLTEGILLKELQTDILLRQYSVVILDEAHERGISTDLLLGLLTRVVRLRWELSQERQRRGKEAADVSPLKLIIMSATLEVETLRSNQRLFPVPPRVIRVDARQFPVSKHFARKTNVQDYVKETAHKVKQVHTRLPPGGMLVFLPTQRTIHQCCSKLRAHFSRTRVKYSETDWQAPKDTRDARTKALDGNEDMAQEKGVDEWGLTLDDYELEDMADAADPVAGGKAKMRDDYVDDDDASAGSEEAKGGDSEMKDASAEKEEEEKEEGDDEEEEEDEECEERAEAGNTDPVLEEEGELDTLHVLPLYALMNPQQQHRVFEPVPPGKRLCVVATNVAETSLTLPGIRYVVDSGRVKSKMYDPTSGVARFEVGWVNKASSEQRAGRAGRVGPGHCYRLYSTAVYANEMPDHAIPEILQSPLESLVLFVKGFWDRSVLAFPFPTPPPRAGVDASLVHLARIGALTDNREKGQYTICPFGSAISRLPLLPKYGKMIVLAKVLWDGESREKKGWLKGLSSPALSQGSAGHVLAAIVGVVAVASSLLDVFLPPATEDKEVVSRFRQVVRKYRHPGSDYLTGLRVLRDFAGHKGDLGRFCDDNFLVFRGMKDTVGLRKQVTQLLASEEDTIDVYGALADEEEVTAERTGDRLKQQQRLLSVLGRMRVPQGGDEEVMLRKIIASGLIDQIARRATPSECELRRPPVPYDASSTRRAPYIQPLTGDILHVHPMSAVAAVSPPPEFVVYTALQVQKSGLKRKLDADGKQKPQKVYMKGVTAVRREWLSDLGWEDTG